MSQTQPMLGPDFPKRTVRFVLSIVGLLILRAILGALPMLKNAAAIGDSLIGPLVIAQAFVDTTIIIVLLRFGLGIGRLLSQNYARFPDVGKMISLATVALALLAAYQVYQVPTACLLVTPSDLGNLGGANSSLVQDPLVREVARSATNMIAGMAARTGGATLIAYQQLAVISMRQPPDLYGWIFLLLIAFPAVGIVVLVARNLDSLTEIVFHSAAASLNPPLTGSGPAVGLPVGGPTGGNGSPAAAVERLGKLKTLVDLGAISDDDFEAQKFAILRTLRATEPEGLRKLKALVDSGALTEEEYAVQKQYFLDHL